MKVVNVPIESLEERYSADWNRWFDEYVKKNNIKDVTTIYPNPIRDWIKEGDFLDVIGTVHFKSEQIRTICKRVDTGLIPIDEKVVFLIQDGWFPIEQLAYLRDMLGCHYWKFVGIFHAGTYSKWDLTARSHMYTWGEDIENGWFKIYDRIIVGSHHHAHMLCNTRKISLNKIHIIPWPVEVPKLDTRHKENIVVFPHRFGVEKQVHEFMNLSQIFFESDWRFISSTKTCKTKQEYYQLLAKSKIAVSFGLEELFGIAMVEAGLLDCMPLVPDDFSYKEIFNRGNRYQGMDQCKHMLTYWMKLGENQNSINVAENLFNPRYYHIRDKFYPWLFEVMEEL